MGANKRKLALVGVTGLVGREVLSILNEIETDFDIIPMASGRSAGEKVRYRTDDYAIRNISPESFDGAEFAIFTAGGQISREFVPVAAQKGVVCIDNSSVFRMDEDVPLVVPEVNPQAIPLFKRRNIIANPNCSTIQLVLALAPVHREANIRRIVVSTYQSVSGGGKRAMDELSEQVIALFNNKEIRPNRFPHQIAFNCIPQIDEFEKSGYSKEEEKLIRETKKILGDPELRVTATAVRVPVFSCHSESVNIETERKISVKRVRELLSESPGVAVLDDADKMIYPMPIDAVGSDDVFVGRIREDESAENCINMWIVADNLRKGAALNAVQILDILVKKYL